MRDKSVLLFAASMTPANRCAYDGIHRYAKAANWNVHIIEYSRVADKCVCPNGYIVGDGEFWVMSQVWGQTLQPVVLVTHEHAVVKSGIVRRHLLVSHKQYGRRAN